MNIKQVMAIVVVSLFFLGTGVMAAEQAKPETGIASYTDRELQLAFENCQLRIQAA